MTYLDGLVLSHTSTPLKDFIERTSDLVCEGILRDIKCTDGFLKEYETRERFKDPASWLPPHERVLVRYVRRLALLDAASWQAMLKLVYPENVHISRTFREDKKWVLHLNKNFKNAKEAFDKISNYFLKVDYRSFKDQFNVVAHIKRLHKFLGIQVKTSEKW